MKEKLLIALLLSITTIGAASAKKTEDKFQNKVQVVCAHDESSYDNAIMKLNGALSKPDGIHTRAYNDIYTDNYQPISSRTISQDTVVSASSPVLYMNRNEFKACVTVTAKYKIN